MKQIIIYSFFSQKGVELFLQFLQSECHVILINLWKFLSYLPICIFRLYKKDEEDIRLYSNFSNAIKRARAEAEI